MKALGQKVTMEHINMLLVLNLTDSNNAKTA